MEILLSLFQWFKASLFTFFVAFIFIYCMYYSRYKHQVIRALGLYMIFSSWVILLLCIRIDGLYAFYYALPLHVCSIMALLEGISVFYSTQLMLEIVYYFGLVGGFFALAIPVYVHERSGYFFYDYFISHGLMIVIVFYHVSNGFVPRKGSAIRCYLLFLIAALVIFCINSIFGMNYWYININPGFKTGVISSVWPYYLIEWYVLGWLIMYLLYLPFKNYR